MTGMDRLQISTLIEEKYLHASERFVTCVICKNDVYYYGHFYSFNDYQELKGKSKFRFIPRNNMKSFLSGCSQNGGANADYSIVIDGESILGIDFVMPLHR